MFDAQGDTAMTELGTPSRQIKREGFTSLHTAFKVHTRHGNSQLHSQADIKQNWSFLFI